ncbi:MAG: hypothetical protein LC776_16935, partial [Acidobacteria bacterium]|nr:hypothetical protein [Acidobacteriota bacterium]
VPVLDVGLFRKMLLPVSVIAVASLSPQASLQCPDFLVALLTIPPVTPEFLINSKHRTTASR